MGALFQNEADQAIGMKAQKRVNVAGDQLGIRPFLLEQPPQIGHDAIPENAFAFRAVPALDHFADRAPVLDNTRYKAADHRSQIVGRQTVRKVLLHHPHRIPGIVYKHRKGRPPAEGLNANLPRAGEQV